MYNELMGWHDDQNEVEAVCQMLPSPFYKAPSPQANQDALNHIIFKKMLGFEPPLGPQQIGDCVSWGAGNFVNFTQVLEAWFQLNQMKSEGVSQDTLQIFQTDFRYSYQ